MAHSLLQQDGNTLFRKSVQTLAWSVQAAVHVHASRDLDMVVHGDDFIIAGCADDLDLLSETLDEKLELVQKARLEPVHDNCVEPLCDVQRLWAHVGRRPTTRRTGRGRAWTPVGTSTDELRRRQAERTM